MPIGEVSLDSTYVPQFRLDPQKTVHIIGFGLVIRPKGGLSVLIVKGLRKASGVPGVIAVEVPAEIETQASLTS